MKLKRLTHLGVPRFISTGIFQQNCNDFRFLIFDRYSQDLQSVLKTNNHQLSEKIVMSLTSQILYSLEYIHSKGFAHADIKGANIMLKNEIEVYLIDYGFAHRFEMKKVYFPKHYGTILYTSRDAHAGFCKKKIQLFFSF